jgi:hypothetical protein
LEDLARRAYQADIKLVRCDDGLVASITLDASATVPNVGTEWRHIDRKLLRKFLEWFESGS